MVYIETSEVTGTGFLVDEDGLVVTNAHVVGSWDAITANLVDGSSYEGIVLGIDEIVDLAIIQLTTVDTFQPMELGNSDAVRVGDEVIALGFPLSDLVGTELQVTRGIISSKRIYEDIEEFQTDAAINPGNSGGPLVNRDGKVIGVNYAKLSQSDGSPVDNVGFSIAVNELKDRMDSLIRGEQVLLPTPTPGSWTTYRNDVYGYELDIAPGWYLDKETDEGDSEFWNDDRTGVIEIFAYELGSDWTLEEHAETELDFLEERAREEAWDVFEITAFQRKQSAGYDYYVLAYRWQSSDEFCVSNDFSLIFLSDFYPSKPYGFAATSGVCEHSLDRYHEQRTSMLSSFVEQDTYPTTPIPTPSTWTSYHNNDYGYAIDIAPGWRLDEETDDGNATFWHEDGEASIDIFTYDLGRNWTLKEHADSERSFLEELAVEEAWKVFEITGFERQDDEQRDYYIMLYRSQYSEEYCVTDGIALIYLSDSYPSKPYGFVVEGGVCEDKLDLYDDARIEMIASFIPK